MHSLAHCPLLRQNDNFFRPMKTIFCYYFSLSLFIMEAFQDLLARNLAIWTLLLPLSLIFFLPMSLSSHQISEKIQHWISCKLLALHSLGNTWKRLRLNLNLTLSLTQTSPDSWPRLTLDNFLRSPQCPLLQCDLLCLVVKSKTELGSRGECEEMNMYWVPGICQVL